MPGHDNEDWTAGTGELWTRAMVQDSWGQDRRDRIDGQDRRDRTDRTGQIGQDNRDGTTVAGQSRYGSWDRPTEAVQPREVNLDWTPWTTEPGQNTADKSGHDSNARTAASVGQLTILLEKDSWHKTAGIGQLRRNSQDRIARTGQPGQNIQRRQSGQYIQDRKQRTRLPEQDSKDRTASTGQGGTVGQP
jgi:hypothetical protein